MQKVAINFSELSEITPEIKSLFGYRPMRSLGESIAPLMHEHLVQNL